MFSENDKFYFIAKRIHKICWISLCAIGGLCFFLSIILSSSLHFPPLIGIGFGGLAVFLLLAGVVNIIGNYSFSKHYDLKAIRDKICDVKDSKFYNPTKTIITESGEQVVVKKQANAEEALKLKSLLDAGIITEEEYNAQINA